MASIKRRIARHTVAVVPRVQHSFVVLRVESLSQGALVALAPNTNL